MLGKRAEESCCASLFKIDLENLVFHNTCVIFGKQVQQKVVHIYKLHEGIQLV